MTTEPIIYPTNVENEQMILSAILQANALYWKVASYLKERHFSQPVHQRIYRAFCAAIEQGIVTAHTLKAQFDADEALSDIDGGQYLSRLQSQTAIVSGLFPIESAVTTLIDLSRRRDLIDLGLQTAAAAQDMQSERDVSSIASDALSSAANIISDTKTSSFKNGYGVIDDILNGLGTVVDYCSTGIDQLDTAMDGGLYPGCVYAFAGKPKTGKTILGCTLASNLAMGGVKVGFLSLEMKKEIIMGRILCRLAGLPPKALRAAGRNIEEIKEKVISVENLTAMKNLHLCYEPSIEFDALKHRLHYLVHNCKVRGFILDYWQIVEGCPRGINEANFLSTVAQWIAGFCKKENVFGIILLQQNDDGTLWKSRGISRATEQLYTIHRCGDEEKYVWLEMEFSRYSEVLHVGLELAPAFIVHGHGPYFKEI